MNRFCRFCGASLSVTFADLGMSPISNNYVSVENADEMEPFYPLHAFVCSTCRLVQLTDYEKATNLFSNEYPYFSSYSDSWVSHARDYARRIINSENLNNKSMVIEIASNDGYLLQFFEQAGIPVLGIEPTANTAKVALEARNVPSEIAFFGKETAERLRARGVQADLMAANNVLAHVPEINDFVSGYPILLKKGGLANVEFPHLLSQIQNNQFDTIYHEHFSYLSLAVARRIFAAHGMRVYDVEELSTHGGSLRLFICHDDDFKRMDTCNIERVIAAENRAGLDDLETYKNFSEGIIEVKCDLLEFLIAARRSDKSVVGYGAPAKGNTLLNYCGVKSDLIEFTVDRSPYKAGKLLPGVRIPIFDPKIIFERKPDYVLILPWNLKDEIISQMSGIRDWGGKFVTPIPQLEVH